MADSEAMAADGTINSATERSALWNRVRPPIYRGIPYIRIAIVLTIMFLYRKNYSSVKYSKALKLLISIWVIQNLVMLLIKRI